MNVNEEIGIRLQKQNLFFERIKYLTDLELYEVLNNEELMPGFTRRDLEEIATCMTYEDCQTINKRIGKYYNMETK